MRYPIPFYLSKGGVLSALIAVIFSPHAYAVPAGRVDFTMGYVSATGADGNARALNKGAEINNGDSISTGDGRVQIRFTDGAYLSLQPRTVFKVENYAYEGKSDGTEKGVFSLVKGGLRTISGLIGKTNRQNYEVRTPTATIGIRGTAYSANQTDDGLTVTVGQGLVSVTNQGGSLTIGSGQSAFVRSPQVGPKMTNEKALAPQTKSQTERQQLQQQDDRKTTIAAGERRTTVGGSVPLSGLTPTPPPTPTVIPPPTATVLTTGPGYTVAYAASGPAGLPTGSNFHSGSDATFDAGGTLKDFSGGGSNINFAGAAAFPPETGSDSLIGWGRWTGPVTGNLPGSGITYAGTEGFHYVTGIPTPTANLNLGSNAVVNYAMLGHTLPSTYTGIVTTITPGLISGAKTLTVTFSAVPTLQMNFNVITPVATYNMANFGAFNLSMVAGPEAKFTASPFGFVCSTGCTADISGFFSGSTAQRVGIAYTIQDFSTSTKGAAAFQRTSPQ